MERNISTSGMINNTEALVFILSSPNPLSYFLSKIEFILFWVVGA